MSHSTSEWVPNKRTTLHQPVSAAPQIEQGQSVDSHPHPVAVSSGGSVPSQVDVLARMAPAQGQAMMRRVQQTQGNAHGQRLAQSYQQQAEPIQTVKKPVLWDVNIPIEPDKTIAFKTDPVTLDQRDVFVSGRMAVKGQALLSNEVLPEKPTAGHKNSWVRELAKKSFSEARPTGTATQIEIPLAGQKLTLILSEGGHDLPAFQVAGHFKAEKRNLTLVGCEITGATLTLDATVWVAPTPSKEAKPRTEAQLSPSDSCVQLLAFAGEEARFRDPAKSEGKGSERSGSLTLKTTMDDFDAKLPKFVKEDKYLQLPEQRAAFFQQMRAYFGSDDKTIEHFAKLRQANVKGAKPYLHDEAATRLEAVQAELGEANMPSSGGVGWPRAECKLAAKQGLGNLHNLGLAVDYNACQAPHLKNQRILDFVQMVSGRSATLHYQPPAKLEQRSLGHIFTYGTAEEKSAIEAKPEFQEWLKNIEQESESLSKASEDLRASLKTVDSKGLAVDLAGKLKELRKNWFEAGTNKEKQAAILRELPEVTKPWLQKLDSSLPGLMQRKDELDGNPTSKATDKKKIEDELDRFKKLSDALNDPSFVFGANANKVVVDPPLAQLADQGFFTLRGKPNASGEAFDANFVKSMAKHGFGLGAAWSTPDSMHFELRWKGPGNVEPSR